MVWALLLVAACLAAAVLLRPLGRGRALDWPVHARRLLTEPEKALYSRLCEAFPQHVVLAHVALSQLIEVEHVRNRRAVFNRVSQLVADFVVCTKAFEVMAVIELDDHSHLDARQAYADARRAQALAAAGHKLVRLHVSRMPSMAELQKRVLAPSDVAMSASAANAKPAVTRAAVA